ncbi:hypothetical protein Zmor_020527 [Zophobas morio]|uniref:Uncharacterized protein n=1 Tax=Zophobas morio TaxID=2755281 RepID=A0AA38I7P5_9CUCU|nr:hypothetical protein Zmor_020527 [Zophobas morio]
MSLIHIRSKENDFEISYSENPINLSGLKGEIALKTASLWYSWDNITEEYKNNEIKYRSSLKGLVQRMSKDPREHKQNEIRKDRQSRSRAVGEDGVRVEQDWKILKLPNDCEIDFSHGKIHELLGFDKKIYKQGINYATKIGNITKDIDQILIHCSLISSSYQNNLKSDVIYAFTPNISPRSLINIEPTHPKYLPINRTDYIFHIRISVTNQLNQLINFNGECLNFVLDIQ